MTVQDEIVALTDKNRDDREHLSVLRDILLHNQLNCRELEEQSDDCNPEKVKEIKISKHFLEDLTKEIIEMEKIIASNVTRLGDLEMISENT